MGLQNLGKLHPERSARPEYWDKGPRWAHQNKKTEVATKGVTPGAVEGPSCAIHTPDYRPEMRARSRSFRNKKKGASIKQGARMYINRNTFKSSDLQLNHRAQGSRLEEALRYALTGT